MSLYCPRLGSLVVALLASAACSSQTSPAPALVIYGSSQAAPAPVLGLAVAGAAPRSPLPRASFATDSAAPSHMWIAMYSLYLSPNPDCTAPFLVQDYGAGGSVKDFALNQVLFQAEPDAGTYPCMIFRMSDVLSMVPERSFGPCDSTQTYVGDIYRDGETDWIDQDGNAIIGRGSDDPAGAVDDHVAIFFTTDTGAALGRGVSSNQLVGLTSPLVSPGQSTLYWDMSGAVQDENGYCSILPRPITFR